MNSIQILKITMITHQLLTKDITIESIRVIDDAKEKGAHVHQINPANEDFFPTRIL